MLTRSIKQLFSKRTISSLNKVMSTESELPVLFNVKDTGRIISLNRPFNLNALNEEMCSVMFDTLNEYSKSNISKLIIIKSTNSPRAFCAGGDVKQVAKNNLSGKILASINFFQKEYSLNYLLATYDKPVIAFMDGITMGGGVGLSIHSPFRVATANTKWAMPEMDIGFFPDIGATFALPKLITIGNINCQMALYLCLSGEVLSGEDAYLLGLASHYVSVENLNSLEERLAEIIVPSIYQSNPSRKSINDEEKVKFFDMVNGALNEFTETKFPKDFKFSFDDDKLNVIEKCFNINEIESVNDIIQKLYSYEGDSITSKNFAILTKNKLLAKSFTSMNVAINLMKKNKDDHIESALRRDLITAKNMCLKENHLSEFSLATEHKLIKKIKTPYPWKLNEEALQKHHIIMDIVNKEMSEKFKNIDIIPNYNNITWTQYPFHLKYQMPTEKAVQKYLKNYPDQNKNEIINYFYNINDDTEHKLGIKLMVERILERISST